MAYNNGFPVGYQQTPYYPQQWYSQTALPTQPINNPNMSKPNNMIWVQGIEGAKSYLLAPNETIALWDTESSVIYLKSADSSGMPSMKILDYTIRNDQQSSQSAPFQNEGTYVTKDDLEEIRNELSKINNRLNNISKKETGRKEYQKNE